MTSRFPSSQRSAPRPSRFAVAAALVVLTAVGVTACGDDDNGTASGPGPSTAMTGGAPATPVGPGDVVADCGDGGGPCVPGAPATVPTATTLGPPGPSDGPGGQAAVAVVPGSVAEGVSEAGTWRALGLVGNASGGGVEGIEVTAELVGTDGRPVGRATAASLVAPVGDGEEVPFEVMSDVPADAVVEVVWSAHGRPGGGLRPLEVATFWVRPFGEARPIEVPGYVDPSGGPYPFVLYGGVTATGSAPVRSPGAVAAWQGPDGRVLAVAAADALEPGTDQPATSAQPGAAFDVVLVVDDPVAGPMLADATPILWGVSR